MIGKEALSEVRLLGVKIAWRHFLRALRGKLLDYPAEMTVEASSRCNLHCVFCITKDLDIEKKRQRAFLSLSEFKRLADEIGHGCPRMNFSLYGEPLLNPEWDQMIAYAEKKGMITTLFTNATLLTRENRGKLLRSKLTRVLASLETFRQDVYEATKCGAELEKTRENIRKLIREKKALGLRIPQIVLRLVVTRKNADDIEAYVREARELGADAVSLKPLTVWPQGTAEYKQAMLNGYVVEHPISRYRKSANGKFILREKSKPCYSLKTPAVLSDGRVCLCWYDSLGETAVGNIQENSFRSIWQGARRFRKTAMRSGRAFFICRECAGIGAKNHRWISL